MLERLLILAGGGRESGEGGTGFKNLMVKGRAWELAGVASHHERGGVWQKAADLGVEKQFIHFPGPWTPAEYRRLVRQTCATHVTSSGWVWPIRGLDPATTINIHPALPPFIGKRMFGGRMYPLVLAAYERGEVTKAGLIMHFVTDFDRDGDYDRGPEFFRYEFDIEPGTTPVMLGRQTNALEHTFQPLLTNAFVTGRIRWSGRLEDPVIYPTGWDPKTLVGL